MTKLTISIFMITLFFLSAYGSFLSAEEMVLCLNSTDQYVVAIEQEGECLEEEKQMKVMGSSVADLKSLTPVALFEDNDECDTEGSVTRIGFDKNGNFKLDEDEIESTTRNCPTPADEESEE